jgi:hypothetical protein
MSNDGFLAGREELEYFSEADESIEIVLIYFIQEL